MSSQPTPNINYNAILVEKHYIPVDIYTQMYSAQSYQNTIPASAHTYLHTHQPGIYTTHQPNTNNRVPSRYNDLLSFFNMQARNTTPINTEPLQSQVITRAYETSSDMDQSFINLLMTAFYTPQTNTNMATNSAQMRLTQTQIDSHSRIITYLPNVDLDSGTCSICAQEWQHGDELRKLTGCRHYFHKACIDTWFREHNTCPLCRTNIVQTPATNGMGGSSGINDVD